MAKGNMFISNGSGKVGNVVLSVSKGQQITRVYQPKVANPRSYAQQLQRAKFANAVKFYKRATQNFFKFAYEDKKSNESDFNAFMRHNVSNATLLSYDQVKSDFYPALGNWQLTQGRLSNPFSAPKIGGLGTMEYDLDFVSAASKDVTIGEISSALVDKGLLSGDIVTFVCVVSPVASLAQDVSSIAAAPSWDIFQFILNTDDDTLLMNMAHRGSAFACEQAYAQSGGLYFSAVSWLKENGDPSAAMTWGCVIVSRKVSSGVYVSTEYLHANSVATTAMNSAKGDDYNLAVAESWKSGTEAILAGGVADATGQTQASGGSSSDTYPSVSYIDGSSLPLSVNGQRSDATLPYTLTGTNMSSVSDDLLNVVSSSGGTLSASIVAVSDTEATLTVSATVTDTTKGVVGSVAIKTGKASSTLLVRYNAYEDPNP